MTCPECPWRRKSLPGWLGPLDADDWVRLAHSDERIACHMSIPTEDETYDDEDPESWETFDLEHCAGAATYRANVAKLPRDSRCPRLKADRETVFATPMEFKEHHGEEGKR